MDPTKPETPEGMGSVKAAISLFGERIPRKNSDKYKTPIANSKTKMDIVRLNESKKFAEGEKARAEFELYEVRNAAKELAMQIEDCTTKARHRRMELQQVRKPDVIIINDDQCSNVLLELDAINQNLRQLKLDMASTLEVKGKAEKEIEASASLAKSYGSFAEELRKEIEEANEEHVLVEIARIEAERELREIESQWAADATQFFNSIEIAKRRIEDLRREVDHAKELEMRLGVTNSDVNVLQGEMELVRAMDWDYSDKRRENDELKAAKKELESIREEGFQYMTAMDLFREEMMHIAEESARLKKREKKSDSIIESLGSKLLKAKSKLESSLAAEERANAIISSLSTGLRQLLREMEVVKKEEAVLEEANSINLETKKSIIDSKSAAKDLEAAIQELEAVKALEAIAIKKLRSVSQRIGQQRSSSFLLGSRITISKSEYDYLRGRAAFARVVADKKVAAAQAWIEALMVEDTLIEQEIRMLRAVEEQELRMIDRAILEEENRYEMQNEKVDFSKLQLARQSIGENSRSSVERRAKMRRASASPGARYNPRSPSFAVKKRRKVMPSLVKFLQKRGNRKT